jgi:hypothetical protein
MPLDALRYDLTPTGLHYLLIHWDIPAVDPSTWRLRLRGRVANPLEVIPDFFTRHRVVDAGPVTLHGRAWSGHAAIERVEVGVDGQWADARLDPLIGAHAWRGWSFTWVAAAVEHELTCRATDAAGHTQPIDQPWNYQGMGNNLVQKVLVSVRPG